MSFSKSCAGRADAIREAVKGWADEQRALDESYSAGSGVVEGHQTQIQAGVLAIETVLERHPDQFLNITMHGSANQDGSGYVNVSYSFPEEQNRA